MRKTVSFGQAVAASEAVLPPRVQEALGELVGVARDGLLALSVGVGLKRTEAVRAWHPTQRQG